MQVCPLCGKENDTLAPFCSNCKAPLPGGSSEGAQPQTDAARESGGPIKNAALILIGIIVLLCFYFAYNHSHAQGIITTVAGNGTPGYTGDAGPATGAELNYPMGVAVDASGNLYIADTKNNRVRMVDRAGIITTVAGTGAQGSSSNGPAISAELNQPTGVAVDKAGNLYIADNQNFCIRKVDASGIITTVAGNGIQGYGGDGGAATGAELNYPAGVAFDASGNLYIADIKSNRIRKVAGAGL